MEKTCDGGCLPAAKTAFEMMKYTPGVERNFAFTLILGNGVAVDGKTYYFDADGRPYDLDAIARLPGRKAAVGACSRAVKPFCDVRSEGCCNPNGTSAAIFRAAQRPIPPFSLNNVYLGQLIVETIRLLLRRRALIRRGRWVDVPYAEKDEIFAIPQLTPAQQAMDYVPFPLPPMTEEIKRQLLRDTFPL